MVVKLWTSLQRQRKRTKGEKHGQGTAFRQTRPHQGVYARTGRLHQRRYYGDLWERKALSKRDRSLITVAALVATYRPEQLVSHLSRAISNGVTQEEITEVITHMAFYAGWPAAMSAAQVAYTVLVEGNKGE